VDLQEVVKLAVADVLPHALHKQIDLGLVAGNPPAQPLRVTGQADALRVLLRNLLDNAVKYTPAGGRVDVSLALADSHPELAVEDSGPGIQPEDRERVYDRFVRAGAEGGRADEAPQTGSGLGLAIVKAIAGRHGATLRLGSSVRLGGLKVDVQFPAEPDSLGA
jgi:two-component system OmpR family sensor kinase